MVRQQYPKLEVNLNALKENVEHMVNLCKMQGVEIAGVTKGTTGLAKCA